MSEQKPETSEQPRVLGLRDATMIVVSSVIGVGIFFTPGGVAKLLPNAYWFFGAWIIGGLLSLGGALANAELGAMFPRAGGSYVYQRAAYHPVVGFVSGWLTSFAIFAGTIATLAVGVTLSLGNFVTLGPITKPLAAIVVIWVAAFVNAYATKAGSALNNVATYLKIAALVGLVVIGVFAKPAENAFAATGVVSVSSFGVALSPIIFSYLGWNASVFVAGEIDNPGKNLPRSLFIGLGISTAIYFLLTFLFVRTLGMGPLANGPPAGFATGAALFGSRGTTIVSLLLMASVFGTLNATTLVGARVAYAMAKDDLFFRAAARLNRERTPAVAVYGQAIAASILVLVLGQFSNVLDYTTFAVVLVTIADTGALYVLRIRDPKRERPYRAQGYPWVPALYLLASIGIAISMIVSKPFECFVGFMVLLSGAVFYALFASRARAAGSAPERR